MRWSFVWALALLLPARIAAADHTLYFTGTMLATDPTYALVPFEVPAGTAEVQVSHVLNQDSNGTDILDFGLWDPNGFRGWGGGNTEDIVVGELAASRSYHPGPMTAGTWNVVIGKALVASAAHWTVVVTLRSQPTLPAETDRTPYTDVPALNPNPGWYAGDFHVHSRESGDARPSLDENATFARAQGLDFIECSDHNTDTQVDLIPQVQAQHSDLLLVPGDEFTTYSGHANGIGALHYVDHRLGLNGRTASQAADEFHAQGALFSVNHPALDLGSLCIGCGWHNDDVLASQVDALEVENGGWNEYGHAFATHTFQIWESYLDQGAHVTPLGGSDDHSAGVSEGTFGSPIAHPTTMVYASELSVPGILDAVRHGRTVVKLESPSDPMIDLVAGDARVGDTVHADSVHLAATITGGNGDQVRWVHNGVNGDPVSITSDPFVYEQDVSAPTGGSEDRWRAEVLVNGDPRTLTNHIWVAQALATPPDAGADDAGSSDTTTGSSSPPDAGGFVDTGGCSSTNADSAVILALFVGMGLWSARRRGRVR
ncbi:MAG: CehA/McbA family metallohydrolase [Deltaproteobacteria bacterium]|nr:CehA/McbA family metallohydrolase [Deltaproteobacteria bacterium]